MDSASYSHPTELPIEYDHSDYVHERMSRFHLGRVLQKLRIRENTQKPTFHEYDLPEYGAGDDILPFRIRRSRVRSLFKRAIVAVPALLLMFFGVVHVLEVVIGRSSFLWNVRIYAELRGNTAQASVLTSRVSPKPCHSSDDYRRETPLFDALNWGCISVEADVWEFDGELYVGETLNTLAAARTLRSLYIDPLTDILDGMETTLPFAGNNTRGVFLKKPEQTFVLLVDFKSSGDEGFLVLEEQLAPLQEKGYLTYWNGTAVVPGAITVVGSGKMPFEMVLANSAHRNIFFDAPLGNLWERPRRPIESGDVIHAEDSKMGYGEAMALQEAAAFAEGPAGRDVGVDLGPFDTTNSYMASVSFQEAVGFVWRGHLSPRQMNAVRGQIRGAKRRGLKVRYWGTPSWPISLRNHVWHVLVKEGADLLDVDELEPAASWEWKTGLRQW